MLKARIFVVSLFAVSIVLAFRSKGMIVDSYTYMSAFFFYWLFSILYYHLRVFNKNGQTTVDYGIHYTPSFGIFAGPLGLFIYESVYRFTVFFYRKWTKKADPDEFLHTFYNIGTFVTVNTIAYYLFHTFNESFNRYPFGFWILMLVLIVFTSLLSDTFLLTLFVLTGDITTRQEAIEFLKDRSLLDTAKTAITNGLLLIFLLDQSWELLIILFMLNYIVSRSFISKSVNHQNKTERDKFEQMAYNDFLTGVHNRYFMDKKMKELEQTEEKIGIIVSDIDKFKKINDTYNHAVGDSVIQHFAEILKSSIKDDDLLFRSGGEEFTIILRNRSFEECADLVQNIMTRVEKSDVEIEYKSKKDFITYTASFGLYFYKTNSEISMEKGYIMADQLLLQSKQLGRNRMTVKNALNIPVTCV
jgi:diguanylate cyclase (GGDEF)-like protein